MEASSRLALGALPFLLFLFVFASSAGTAYAGSPSHPTLLGDPLNGFALNHACGAATNSEGDIYVSNAGNNSVEVFDPDGNHLATVANSNTPCSLAVDSNGKLYVSESATGNVVCYTPNVYPLTGSPVYSSCGPPVDSSGEAKGISVDPTDDRLYVAEGARVSVYNSDGSFGAVNEVQQVSFFSPTGGTFRLAMPAEGGPGRNEIQWVRRANNESGSGTFALGFEGQTTAAIPQEATAAEVEAALKALPAIDAGDVSVTGFPGVRGYWVEFTGALAEADVPLIEADGTALEDANKTILVGAFSDISNPIPFGTSAGEVESKLGELDAIGSGNVEVEKLGSQYRVAFIGELAKTNVEMLVGDGTGLENASWSGVEVGTLTNGFSGQIGVGDLTDATGVAAYTYVVNEEQSDRYLFAADAATSQVKLFSGPDIRKLKLRKTIKGPKSGEDFGFGAASAYLAADQGSCPPTKQACTAGHFLVYDDAHEAVDEFEATGQFLTQIPSPGPPFSFDDAQPTAIAVDRSGGPNDGTIYVTSGAGPGAKVLAFGPLTAPSRPPRTALSFNLKNARAVAVDRHGNRYLAADSNINVYPPAGNTPLTTIVDPERPKDLAVDSAGNVYAIDGDTGIVGGGRAVYFAPDSFPPVAGTEYSGPTVVATASIFDDPNRPLGSIGINPANGHLFVSEVPQTIEFDSAASGSGIVNPNFAPSLGISQRGDLAVDGANGDVYIADHAGAVFVVNPAGTEVLARISGAGSPAGPFGGINPAITVDQSNGHALVFDASRGVAEEYEPSGAFVAQFGEFFTPNKPFGIAIDNSGLATDGNVYVAFDDTPPGSFDLTAFGPLTYGAPPIAVTGAATEVGGGNATLNGTVDPQDFPVTDCHFEYVTDTQYIADGKTFASATPKPCAESLASIGSGSGAVNVHTDLTNLDPDARYRFRLLAQNKFGTSKGDPGIFGPPLLITKPARPISYTEAILRAAVDPSGLPTTYRFEYVDDTTFQADVSASGAGHGFDHATKAPDPDARIPAGDGSVDVQVPLFNLTEGTEYHFQVIVQNDAKTVTGPDQTLTTLQRAESQSCPNAEFRTGLSANLPDCRAYELVTPADTRGSSPYATDNGTAGAGFNNWLVTPRGQGAGESLAYFIDGTLPGFDGNGVRDGYRAARADGLHPSKGWSSRLFSPSYREAGGRSSSQQGVASDQEYSFWGVPSGEAFATLAAGSYLRTPTGFEPVGQGSLGTDLGAVSRYVSAGGAHVIFFSKAHLEPEAPPAGTVAVYDRAAAGSSAHLVSLLPGEATPGAGQDATYVAATEDGTAVVFRIGGALYLRRDNAETVKVADAPNTFAGISEDGKRVFYVDAAVFGDTPSPAGLWVCDVAAGPCAGPGAHAPTEIAPDSRFVNVSADGSHVYFTSTEVLDAGGKGTLGENNLYLYDGSGIRFIALLDPQDFVGFGGQVMSLGNWSTVISAGFDIGRANSPTRSTPDGELLVFQSHAQLTPYDNEGFGEIYRYDAAATPGQQLSCASCDPTGAPPSADAVLQSFVVTHKTTLIPNLTDDGREVFFESSDPLLPEDANSVTDVYEWKAPGEGCKRAGGCLALISSGQGDHDSFLYGMSADGHDVFFRTLEKLVGADIAGSPSIYDARVEGGIPDPPTPAPCQGDACQGQGSLPPVLPSPASTGAGAGNATPVHKHHRHHRHKHHKKKQHHRKGRSSR